MNLLFWMLACMSALFAIATVTTRHILRSAIFLMFVLSATAGLYLWVGSEFLAGIQILVYVGGIVVLLVFAVMMTRSEDLLEDHPSWTRRILGGLGAGTFFAGTGTLLSNTPALIGENQGSLIVSPPNHPALDLRELGRSFLDMGSQGYAIPFEVISILLLAVLIGSIVIARQEGTKD